MTLHARLHNQPQQQAGPSTKSAGAPSATRRDRDQSTAYWHGAIGNQAVLRWLRANAQDPAPTVNPRARSGDRKQDIQTSKAGQPVRGRAIGASSYRTVSTGEGEQGWRTTNGGSGGGQTPQPAPAQASQNHCVPRIINSSLPSGHITATTNTGRLSAPFDMTADFDFNIPCTGFCGEYRQFVRGFMQENGSDVAFSLCSNTMSRTAWHEDCVTETGTNYKYGYHSLPFPNSNFTNPDQATGESYRGHDDPGSPPFSAFASGTTLAYQLEFQGKWVDACDNDRAVSSSTWTVGGSHTVP